MRAFLLVQLLWAAVQLPRWFADEMVLQTNSQYGARSFLNGRARPGETVSVLWRGSTYSVAADEHGAWEVTLNPCNIMESAPATITVRGDEGPAVQAHRVTCGDVTESMIAFAVTFLSWEVQKTHQFWL